MDTINLRINYLAENYFKGNNVKFSEAVGSSEANIRNYRKSTPPKVEFIVKTCDYLNISIEWLLTGKGEIEKTKPIEYKISEEKLHTVNESNPVYENSKYVKSLEKNVELLEEKLQQCEAEKKILENHKTNV